MLTPITKLAGLFLLLLFCQNSVQAQREIQEQWYGLHNLHFKNKRDLFIDTAQLSTQMGILTRKDFEKNYSFGLHYRLVLENSLYHQFDIITLAINEREDLLLFEAFAFQISEPTRGSIITDTDLQLGYRLGKLFTIAKGLTADASTGFYPTYKRLFTQPLTSAGFPKRQTRLGLGIDLRLGLNYQLHPRVNIGYHISPALFQWFWLEDYTENPILTQRQKSKISVEMQTTFFEDLLQIQNFRISYVVEADSKRRKKRRRRR